MIKTKNIVLFISIIMLFVFLITKVEADQDLISLFPIEHYDQHTATWINPNSEDYDQSLLKNDVQQNHYNNFIKHYFSPWDPDYITQILTQSPPNDLKTTEESILTEYSNVNKSDDKIGYGENFRPYPESWITQISANVDTTKLSNLTYSPNNRAIAIDNLHARALPTEDVHLYSYKLAGQGYPFDNLQMSSLWAGTLLYVISETKDHAWSLVLTPEYIAWVKTNGIAHVSNTFAKEWEDKAKNHLGAITETNTSLMSNNQFLISAYIGSVFPAEELDSSIKLMVPVSDQNKNAAIRYASVSKKSVAIMPLFASPHHFSNLMDTMNNRPYGWGNMYLYNDCSGELKNIFTPFGIWLPRHSSNQVLAGKMIDKTTDKAEERLAYLKTNGHKFFTIVYIGGHDFMYIGNTTLNNEITAMTYQNIWGLSPNPPSRRAVIGESVFFPLLLQYPEDQSLVSLANKKYFQVSFLDEVPNYLLKLEKIDIRSLMSASL